MAAGPLRGVAVLLVVSAPGTVETASGQSQPAPCALGKSVRFSGAPVTAASDMLPSGRCYRVSMSALGELCYTSASPSTAVPQWVLFNGRGAVPPGVYEMSESGEAWDISADVLVGAEHAGSTLVASSWDLAAVAVSNPPLQTSTAHLLPPGATFPSALVGVAETGTPARVCGWASRTCSGGPGSSGTTHGYWGWVPSIVVGSSQWMGETNGQGCPSDIVARAESEARHVNILGFPVGRMFGTPATPGSCASVIPASPYQLPAVDAVRWKANTPGSPGVPTQLPRLQVPNGARAERTSEVGYAAGWAGFTANPACGQAGPVPGTVHATVWGPPPLGGMVDLQTATLPFASSSVASAIEETGGNNIGLTVGGQRDGSTAVLWRQCAGWTAIDVADIVLEAGDIPGAAASGGTLASYEVKLARSDSFQIVTDVVPNALFSGYMGGRPFGVTVFADLDSNLRVGASDLATLLSAWGMTPNPPAGIWDTRDLDQSGVIDNADAAVLLGHYSGVALVDFPNICGCAEAPVEARMSFEDALLINGFQDVESLRDCLFEAVRADPLQAEDRVATIAGTMFYGGDR